MKSILHIWVIGLMGLFNFLALTACSQTSECPHIGGGSVSFDPASCRLKPEAQTRLGQLAEQMRADPACRVVVMGNAGGNKPGQQLSWERIQAVIGHMSESNNIDRNRFIFVFDGDAGLNEVTFYAAESSDDRPSRVPEPQPGSPPCQ